MASIRKRGAKYEAQVRRKGFQTITRSFSFKRDAQEWAREKERQADRQELPTDRKALEGTTLGNLATRYLKEVVPTKKGAASERYVLNAFKKHPICGKPLSDLTPLDFISYRDERLKAVTPATLKRQLNTIRHLLNHAADEWDIPLRRDLLSKIKIKGADNKRERRLRDGEYAVLSTAAEDTRNPYLMLVVDFALETAMRRGEILALRWNDIDLSRQSATIVEAKNGYSRVIPLTPLAAQSAVVAGEVSGDTEGNSLVFPVSPNAFKLAWQRMLRRATITDLHFHDMRHEAISRLFELGLTAPEVASISGHRDLRMLGRYAHANHQRVREKLGLL